MRDLLIAEKSLTPSTQIVVSKYHSKTTSKQKHQTRVLGEMADSRARAEKIKSRGLVLSESMEVLKNKKDEGMLKGHRSQPE